MSNRYLLLLLTLVVAVSGWQLYEGHQRERALNLQVQELTRQLASVEQRLLVVETQAAKLREESMGEVVRKANGALLDAWKGLLQKLDEEVDAAREEIDRQYESPEPESLKRT